MDKRVLRPLTRSQRQYGHVNNAPAQRLARTLKDVKPAPMPNFVEPALASLVAHAPPGEHWVHEIKFDGYRFQAHVTQGGVRFLTRRGHDWSARVPSLVTAAQRLKTYAAIVDGEVVVQDESGSTDFNELERELGKRGGSPRLIFYAFDLLYLDALDLRGSPLLERKEVLAKLLKQSDPGEQFRYSDHQPGDGKKIFARACELGLEGIISKRVDGRYRSGRTDAWVKTPCRLRDTFVVAGWAMKGNRFDGFYLGESRNGSLSYVGKIEQGWTEEERDDLLAELAPLRRPTPAIELPDNKPKARWVEPRVLVDVEYRAKTKKSGLLRHPSFKGVRRDLMDELKPKRRSRTGLVGR